MTEITTPELTESTVNGNGVFDALMQTTKAHLDQEFSKNRIKGAEYSQVYLGALQSSMQYAIQFLLERQRADAQASLLAEQAVTEQKQQALLEQQTLNAAVEHEVLAAQECKLKAEFDLLRQQNLKAVEETALLAQKRTTERANTVGEGVDPDSLIGRKKALYKGQADGYIRDAEQKAAKLLADTWNVRRTTDEGTVADGVNKLGDQYIGRAIDKLLNGVKA